MHTTESLANALRAAGNNLFRHESSYPDREAERNLQGRTHYVDPSTRKYFGSRILSATVHSSTHGLIFSIRESVYADPDKTRRVFRRVAFDIFGTVIERLALCDSSAGHSASDKADKVFYEWFNAFDVVAHYVTVLEARAKRLEAEATALRAIVAGE